MTITAEDFHAVLELVTPLYRHATHILSFLPSTEVKHRANADRDALFEMMGNQFTRAQLLEQAEKMKIKPNTALSWLNRLIKKGLLINTDDKGVYTRTHVCVLGNPRKKCIFCIYITTGRFMNPKAAL